MDFKNIESVIDNKCKVLILSNPHNPAGIVWDRDTLKELARICKKHNILVISDEIHSEMTHKDIKHTPLATVSEEAESNSITFMAPSKTFNMPGIVTSYAIVADEELRMKFYSYLQANELNDPPLLSPIATIEAYKCGNEWRKQMLKYVMENIIYIEKFMKDNIPAIKVMIPQASFLVWLDCRELGLSQDELKDLFVNKAGLALNDGNMFGKEGMGYMRLNVGTSRDVLTKAMESLREAINNNY